MSPLRLIGIALLLAAGASPNAEAAGPAPVIGCPSLVNLRLLMRQTKADTTVAAAILGDDKADHLGCAVLARDAITALQERLSLNGSDYDCLSLRSTSVCHWVVAGAVNLSQPPTKARAGEKSRAAEKPRR